MLRSFLHLLISAVVASSAAHLTNSALLCFLAYFATFFTLEWFHPDRIFQRVAGRAAIKILDKGIRWTGVHDPLANPLAPPAPQSSVRQGHIAYKGLHIQIEHRGQDGNAILAQCEKLRKGVDTAALDALQLVKPILAFAVNMHVLKESHHFWESDRAAPETLRYILQGSAFLDRHQAIVRLGRLANTITAHEDDVCEE